MKPEDAAESRQTLWLGLSQGLGTRLRAPDVLVLEIN